MNDRQAGSNHLLHHSSNHRNSRFIHNAHMFRISINTALLMCFIFYSTTQHNPYNLNRIKTLANMYPNNRPRLPPLRQNYPVQYANIMQRNASNIGAYRVGPQFTGPMMEPSMAPGPPTRFPGMGPGRFNSMHRR